MEIFSEESKYGHYYLQERNSQFNTQKQMDKYAFNFTKVCYLWGKIWLHVCLSCLIVNEIFGGWRKGPPILPTKQSKENVSKWVEKSPIHIQYHEPSWTDKDTYWIPSKMCRRLLGKFPNQKSLSRWSTRKA